MRTSVDSREGGETRVPCECPAGTMSRLSDSSTSDSLGCLFSDEVGALYCAGRTRQCLTDSWQRFSLVFCNIFRTIFLDKRILVLLILLNPLLTESSPTHRVRHRHVRHTLRSDRLCDKPQVMDHPHDQECRRIRVRRDIHHMNLREGENSTMCDYRVCVDRHSGRMPQEIHRVFCVESGCRCQEEGSFRCTQLTNKVEVWYGLRMERVEVEVGCVCAAKHALHLHNFDPSSISVDKK